jgi:hypothetical protein
MTRKVLYWIIRAEQEYSTETVMPRESQLMAPRRGRPRKFARPSRAVTLTLPEDVITALSNVDPDLSRAVVRVVQPQMRRRAHPPAELCSFGSKAVIVINPSKTLEAKTGVLLIPLSDGRALISFDESLSIARLELAIRDVLDDATISAEDGGVFSALAGILRTARRSGDVSLSQRTVIVLESARPRRARVPVSTKSARRETRRNQPVAGPDVSTSEK